MTEHAEYVSPGHPDRLADAIAEGIVTAAVRDHARALVGVEVALHRDRVFVDGRIAAGPRPIDVEGITRDVYRFAGYGGGWDPAPASLTLLTDLCEEALPDEEGDVRPFADDQNIVTGHAGGDARTNFLPTAHWVAGEIGRWLHRKLRADSALSDWFGPDLKVLAILDRAPAAGPAGRITWRRLVVSVLHRPGLGAERQHRLLLPLLAARLEELERAGLAGVAATFSPGRLVLNGAGDFTVGGPRGDNGLSGKKLVVDHYGPTVPIGGGALSGKDPHKVDKCGPLRARQLAKSLVRAGADAADVTLSWAPGADAPPSVVAVTTRGGVRLRIPDEELPPPEWFGIARIVADLELLHVDWGARVLDGYFRDPAVAWER
jgi:S-adenosylmethionine synthetase